MEAGHWQGIWLSRHGLVLFHLCFADDLFLCGIANEKQDTIMEIVLRDFYNFFAGQRVNMEQSQLAFSTNVKPEVSNWLLSQFAIIVAQNFGVYLEMPLLHCRVGKGTYHFLVEKMRKKHIA